MTPNQDNFGPTDLNAVPATPANGVDIAANTGHIFDVGANYVQSFGDFNVAASVRWGTGSNTLSANAPVGAPDTPTVFGAGLNLGYAGFTIGGSWAESNEHNGGQDDGNAYDIGASYATGPWTFSLTYFHGENEEEPALVVLVRSRTPTAHWC